MLKTNTREVGNTVEHLQVQYLRWRLMKRVETIHKEDGDEIRENVCNVLAQSAYHNVAKMRAGVLLPGMSHAARTNFIRQKEKEWDALLNAHPDELDLRKIMARSNVDELIRPTVD